MRPDFRAHKTRVWQERLVAAESGRRRSRTSRSFAAESRCEGSLRTCSSERRRRQRLSPFAATLEPLYPVVNRGRVVVRQRAQIVGPAETVDHRLRSRELFCAHIPFAHTHIIDRHRNVAADGDAHAVGVGEDGVVLKRERDANARLRRRVKILGNLKNRLRRLEPQNVCFQLASASAKAIFNSIVWRLEAPIYACFR